MRKDPPFLIPRQSAFRHAQAFKAFARQHFSSAAAPPVGHSARTRTRQPDLLTGFLTPAPACVTCAVYGKTIRHAQQTSNTFVWVLYYGGVFWDVGRRQRGLVFLACLWRLGVMYGA
jgi:hypothetical protein